MGMSVARTESERSAIAIGKRRFAVLRGEWIVVLRAAHAGAAEARAELEALRDCVCEMP